MKEPCFKSGDTVKLPWDREFGEDFFVITRVRPFNGTYILDAFCEGAEDIQISVDAKQVVRAD